MDYSLQYILCRITATRRNSYITAITNISIIIIGECLNNLLNRYSGADNEPHKSNNHDEDIFDRSPVETTEMSPIR